MNFGNENQGLKTVNVGTAELIESIEQNMVKHVDEYNKSVAERELFIVEKLYEAYSEASNGKFIDGLSFPEIETHEDDYKAVIDMLKMSVDETVSITTDQFQRYVRDNWEWKRKFLMSGSLYK